MRHPTLLCVAYEVIEGAERTGVRRRSTEVNPLAVQVVASDSYAVVATHQF